ncbi:MAG: hypothetical protein ACE1Y4_03375 [Lysobacterales bacterium]
MIACDVKEHRELVGWMARTLAACRRSNEMGLFNMSCIMHQCGSPGCLAGHGAMELPKYVVYDELPSCRRYLGFPIKNNMKYPAEDVDQEQRNRLCRKIAMQNGVGTWWFCPMTTEEAFRRWTLTMNYRRRQLAQLEVEAGEWGRSKPARDMPVGQKRERQVQEMMEVA